MATKNAELDEIETIVGAYIQSKLRTFTSPDTFKNENTLRYPVDMLNTTFHRSALPNYTLIHNEGFIVMLLNNLNPLNVHVIRTG